ncbi:hypothetical protein [Leptolyngbya sp. FACHB-17]|nr:hypothetical protein [Leptolyngbya sp. FACHB-17]
MPKIYALIREMAIVKAIVFVINLAVFAYLKKTFPRHRSSMDS